jgi:hypothetical protein
MHQIGFGGDAKAVPSRGVRAILAMRGVKAAQGL